MKPELSTAELATVGLAIVVFAALGVYGWFVLAAQRFAP